MVKFEDLQIAGMAPSLLRNKIEIPREAIRRLCQKIQVLPNGCWEWHGAKSKGYGVVKIRAVRGATNILVHRLCYELVHGRIGDEFDAHHQVENGCIGRPCCNPEHIKPVTRREHLADLSPNNVAFINSHSPTCKNGHPWTIDTVAITTEGWRRCRECDSIIHRESADAKREAEGRVKGKWHAEHLQTHCKRGHEFTPENSYFQNGYRSCLACRHMHSLNRSKSKA